MEGHTIITSLHPDGEPKSPKGVKTTVVNQCGCYVRDHIPISFKLWKKSKATDIDADVVPETEKEMLWADVKRHFTFPEDKEQLFKDWVMKKMAIAFQTFKKNLNKDYVKKGLTPDFEKNFKNQRPYWEAFVQYKSSEDSEKKTAQAKENASKKKHFHHLGQGGYASAIPKWQKMEDDLVARGIVPATFNWPLRAKHYFYAHGGSLNMEDGSFVTSDAIREAADRLDVALKTVSEGSFKSDREKDELTYALGTPEQTGRVRGMGVVPWKHGFSGDIETYRSWQRRKAEVAEKVRALE